MEGMKTMIIRSETAVDRARIAEITQIAFKDCPHGTHNEHRVIDALREANALAVSLVCVIDGAVVGHIAFSPVEISDGSTSWYGLGPISVLPQNQNAGIGSALLQSGLDRIRELGAHGCVLVGEPRYYERFGFKSCPEFFCDGVPPENLLVLPFDKGCPKGKITFHPAFFVE